MPPGKLASQAGHAYLGAFLVAPPEVRTDYTADGIGTKICLRAKNLEQLHRAHHEAQVRGLPCVLIEDTGRNTTFGGVPTVSALGVGPLTADQAAFLRKFPLL